MASLGTARRCALGGQLCAAILLFGVTSLAQSTPDELARRHFESGAAYLQESDYESALSAFQKAYELSKRPEILLNIATVEERQGKLAAAVVSLERYLEVSPQGEHVETVRNRITNLKKRMETEAPPPTATPAAPEPAAPQPAPPPPAVAPTPPPPAPPPSEPAEPNRVPAYVALGLGGVAAAGAILTGIFAKAEYDDAKDSCDDHCTDEQVSSGRTLAVTSTVLTGFAIVGAAVGATLWLTAGSGSEQASVRPALGLRIEPQSAAARALRRF
jgi:tetratricopeptide (TPR) repeat protein